jgi:hypothetical protein
VADSNSLHLTSAMTLMAWVKVDKQTGWRNILLKQNGSDLAYALYANDNQSALGYPGGYVNIGGAAQLVDSTESALQRPQRRATWDGRCAGHLWAGPVVNGTSDLVAIADAPDLEFTTGMTLEAWVRPNSVSGWQSLLEKEGPNGLVYALYASDPAQHAGGFLRVAGLGELLSGRQLQSGVQQGPTPCGAQGEAIRGQAA